MTVSICACDPAGGMVALAMSASVLGVGAFNQNVHGGVGAIATLAYLNPYLGYDGLKLLAKGKSPEEVLEQVLRGDPNREWRQMGIVDAAGHSAAFTGSSTDPWSGHRIGQGYAIAGNLLSNGDIVPAMAEAFETDGSLPLPDRVMHCLEVGWAVGGDRPNRKAGTQSDRKSAFLIVARQLEMPYIDLRVDEHSDPVAELRRLLNLASETMIPLGGRFSTTRELRPLNELIAKKKELDEMYGPF